MTDLTQKLGLEYPIFCGAMYPCSNPELVAAVSEAGGMGIIQPLSLVYVYEYDFLEGFKYIHSLTKKPVGLNVILESRSKIYQDRMRKWVDIALEQGCRFFVTALGNPRWVVERVKSQGALVFHDVTEKKWALKALDQDVDGFIAVNQRAGGHAGNLSAEVLYKELESLGKPLVCAGGISTAQDYKDALNLGYQGVQMGTRFIASQECLATPAYKQALIQSSAKDIVLTEHMTGVPVSVINTPYVQSVGTHVSPLMKYLLRHPKTKHMARGFYALRSLWKLKRSSIQGKIKKDYWQAGQSVEGIQEILPVKEIIQRLTQ